MLILFLPVILVLIPYLYFQDKKNKRLAKKYLLENIDKTYFFYSNKKGWGDFIINNVLPVLPKDTYVYNVHNDKDNPLSMIYTVIDITKTPWTDVKLPFVIKLSPPTLKVLTLHNGFNAAKKTPKKDAAIQADIKDKIENILNP